MILKYEDGDAIIFKVDYRKEEVKFINGTIHDKKNMSLNEFALSVLGTELNTKELIAAFIGKEVLNSYQKKHKYYVLNQRKIKKNYFEGSIQKIEA